MNFRCEVTTNNAGKCALHDSRCPYAPPLLPDWGWAGIKSSMQSLQVVCLITKIIQNTPLIGASLSCRGHDPNATISLGVGGHGSHHMSLNTRAGACSTAHSPPLSPPAPTQSPIHQSFCEYLHCRNVARRFARNPPFTSPRTLLAAACHNISSAPPGNAGTEYLKWCEPWAEQGRNRHFRPPIYLSGGRILQMCSCIVHQTRRSHSECSS